ncbi:hypothetical protein LTR78_007249 [Recurvomyces mirabilis]|uniref:Uncharacterized protein n=1 Tax=Recurvomyces mirabilis TaxID=574656 RepID=A0AAE0WJK2_9PEZI|nr:hypothetical protein LTR78_007249 [Recurvomyces mirabilis]KAK5155508.1 hypothetical protein LTS14_005769 [Recurvomyces mirabilis]
MLLLGVLDLVREAELIGAIYAFEELAELVTQLTNVSVTVTVDPTPPELGADDVLTVVEVALLPPLFHETRLLELFGQLIVTVDTELIGPKPKQPCGIQTWLPQRCRRTLVSRVASGPWLLSMLERHCSIALAQLTLDDVGPGVVTPDTVVVSRVVPGILLLFVQRTLSVDQTELPVPSVGMTVLVSLSGGGGGGRSLST